MTKNILGTRVDPTSYEAATALALKWAQQRESRYVCVANVHMVMEAYDAPDFRKIVNAADLVTPDGMPLVWMLHRMGYPAQSRVYGPDLMIKISNCSAMTIRRTKVLPQYMKSPLKRTSPQGFHVLRKGFTRARQGIPAKRGWLSSYKNH